MKRLIIVFAILGFGLLMLFFNNQDGHVFGMEDDRFANLVSLAPLAALLGAGILAGRRQWGESARHIIVWLVILLALGTAYLYRDDMRSIGDRIFAGLIPGRAVVVTNGDGEQEVILHKSMNGHFEANVTINGQEMSMLVDTGASMIALSQRDAERAGIIPENLTYSLTVMTANGAARAAPITLTEVRIGPIVRRNIDATVAEQGKLNQSLLGMSFLGTLGSLQMQTDELRLRN